MVDEAKARKIYHEVFVEECNRRYCELIELRRDNGGLAEHEQAELEFWLICGIGHTRPTTLNCCAKRSLTFHASRGTIQDSQLNGV